MQHPDEGTIHAWLDGALPGEQARALEEHVAGCAPCAGAVAEARGMTAGASRILASLDHAPAGVIPPRAAARRPGVRRAAWFRRPGVGIAAAMAIVATGTTWAVTRGWDDRGAAQSEQAIPAILGASDSGARIATAPAPESAAVTVPREAASRDVAADRQPAPAQPAMGDALGNRQDAENRVGRASADAPAPPPVPLPIARERAEAVAEQQSGAGAAKARQAETTESARAGLTDSVAVSGRGRTVASPAPAAPRRRAMEADELPVISGLSLTETARAVAGCYALELGQAFDGSRPDLPNVVRLAESTTEAAGAAMAPPPPAQGFRMSPNPLLVPPALDSGQLGWRMARSDSVSMLIAGERGALQVTFPAVMDGPRVGTVTSGSLTGVESWSAPVVVERVPCVSR
jgi:hypothetical protein